VKRWLLAAVLAASVVPVVPAAAQVSGFRPDSIAVVGLHHTDARRALADSRLVADSLVTYRDVQRALKLLYATGAYAEVAILRDSIRGKDVLVIRLHERPILAKWTIKGVERLSEATLRDKVQLVEGRPLDAAGLARAQTRLDSMYRAAGYYLAQIRVRRLYDLDSSHVRLVFDVAEGPRVAISQMSFEGNTHFPVALLAAQMHTRPEGFWWFRSGEYNDDDLREDLFQRLPAFYASQGYVDFQVLGDTVVVDDTTGKAALVVRVSEGDHYHVGSFEIAGNRRFSTSELDAYYPFRAEGSQAVFDQGAGGTLRATPSSTCAGCSRSSSRPRLTGSTSSGTMSRTKTSSGTPSWCYRATCSARTRSSGPTRTSRTWATSKSRGRCPTPAAPTTRATWT
jgi:outer membrane protein insertion porin family